MTFTKGEAVFIFFVLCLLILSAFIILWVVPEWGTEETGELESTEPEFEYSCLGDFTVTYYCSCEVCCEEWAKDRPKVNGKEIVFTASGAVAKSGITIAVDPKVIPYGSTVYIEGVGYRVAQDCGGAIKGNKIDVYVQDHEATFEGGKHTSTVYLMLG